jgi:uncharacterized membrane protein YkoI
MTSQVIDWRTSLMHTTIRKSAAAVAALSAFGLGGAALAGAAGKGSSSSSSSSGTSTTENRPARGPREALSADVAAKVKAAALDKVPGATVLRSEAGGPYGTAYHAHVKKADGTLAVVLVDSSFKATTVQADSGGGGGKGRHGGRGGGPGGGETALTGDTKTKVEAAVKAKLPGATIVRTETNDDGTAPYESHVTKSDGTEAEVLVSKTFEVVEVRERPARP